MESLKGMLEQMLPRPNMATVRSSAGQTDPGRGTHPSSVQRWHDFDRVLEEHRQELPDTKKRFVCSLFDSTPVSISEDHFLDACPG